MQRFFPIEITVGVGEIKSILTKKDLFNTLHNLSKTKEYRLNIADPVCLRRDKKLEENKQSFNQKLFAYDQIFTFLIFEKFDFNLKNIHQEINETYQEIESGCRHNIVLSIEDGILFYYDEQNKSLQFPIGRGTPLKGRFKEPGENRILHIKYFCQYFFMAMTSITILYPELRDYMENLVGGINHDE